MPAIKFFYRKLKKFTPEYTMYPGCRYNAAVYCKENGLKRVLITLSA